VQEAGADVSDEAGLGAVSSGRCRADDECDGVAGGFQSDGEGGAVRVGTGVGFHGRDHG
jgi:hypothetical protein